MASKKINQYTGITLVKTYFVLLLVNGLVFYLANSWFPAHVVLGTAHLTFWWSVLLSASELAIIGTLAVPFIRELENKKGRMLTKKEWIIKYFFINFFGVWLIARFADQLGMGISSWTVAAILALVLDLTQSAAMMQLEKTRK